MPDDPVTALQTELAACKAKVKSQHVEIVALKNQLHTEQLRLLTKFYDK